MNGRRTKRETRGKTQNDDFLREREAMKNAQFPFLLKAHNEKETSSKNNKNNATNLCVNTGKWEASEGQPTWQQTNKNQSPHLIH